MLQRLILGDTCGVSCAHWFCQKWFYPSENLNVVMDIDSNAARREWKVGRIECTSQISDRPMRNFDVRNDFRSSGNLILWS